MPAVAARRKSALLAKAGANSADPNIRSTVNQETGLLAEQDRTLIDDLIFWRKPDRPGTVVDPAKEQQRIREAQAVGQPVTTGATPTIKQAQAQLAGRHFLGNQGDGHSGGWPRSFRCGVGAVAHTGGGVCLVSSAFCLFLRS